MPSGEKKILNESLVDILGIPFVPAELISIIGNYNIICDSRTMEIRMRRHVDGRISSLNQLRHGIHPDKIRIVFHLTEEVPFKVMQTKNPPRVIIDFQDTNAKKGLDTYFNHIAVDRVRVTTTEGKSTKAVIELNYALPDVEVFWLRDPVRLVVDLPIIYSSQSALTIAPGIRYITLNAGMSQGPVTVDILEVMMDHEKVRVETALAGTFQDFGLAPVSELVSRFKAIAGINGVFHASDGTPLGLIIIDGKLRSLPIMDRTAMGITRDGEILIDNVSVDTSGNLSPNWLDQGVIHAVGGGPRLVKDGEVHITSFKEQFKADVALGRAPRTAIGVTNDNKLLLIAVTGRKAYHSVGVT